MINTKKDTEKRGETKEPKFNKPLPDPRKPLSVPKKDIKPKK